MFLFPRCVFNKNMTRKKMPDKAMIDPKMAPVIIPEATENKICINKISVHVC